MHLHAAGAVKKQVAHVCGLRGATAVEVSLEFPLASADAIVAAVRQVLESQSFRLAVFDHIPSNYGFVMPVRQLVDLCHAHGAAVLVDGAHSLGSLDLDVPALGADFYVSNAHKWLGAPKGVAFL